MLLIPKKELDRVGGNINAVDRSVIIDTDDSENRADLFFNIDELISVEQAKAKWENSHFVADLSTEGDDTMAVDYNELLYQKVRAEYGSFIEELKRITPEQVLEHAYEKVIKEEIVCECELKPLGQQEAKALYFEKHPLDRIYRDWLDNDYSYMDQIRNTISYTAKDATKEMKEKSRESR